MGTNYDNDAVHHLAAQIQLKEALKANLTPHAIVAIAADLTPATRDRDTNNAVDWFRDLCINTVGVEGYSRMLEEIGY